MKRKYEMNQRVVVTVDAGDFNLEGATGRVVNIGKTAGSPDYLVQLDRRVPGYGAQLWFLEPSLEAE